MSLITSCPACATQFKAVPDQLRIADGWVRCGRCNEVFNASLRLCPSEVFIAAEVEHRTAPVPPAPEPVTPTAEQELLVAEQLQTSGALTFLHQERANLYRHQPKRRALLSFAIAVLLLGLAGQVVLYERNRLLALEPELKPWLLAFCAPLNCKLSALQQKESIVIDGAAFTKITRNSYRLNFTVKNTSTLALAVPSIELTLTDASEQPVLRRVFTPAELDLKADTLAAGSEWSASLAMLVNPSGTASSIVGYRLYVFYA